MMKPLVVLAVLVPFATACTNKGIAARTDSLEARLAQQQSLASQLSAQKDSLVSIVVDADAFLGRMDSAIGTVKGLPRSKRKASDPIANQLQARKEMQDRVNALVARAKSTASQLAEMQRQNTELQKENSAMRDQLADQAAKIEADAQLIAGLTATIERQTTQIAQLEMQLDSIGTRMVRAYYVIGTEKELIARGIVRKEGGTNLLIIRPGRTLVPARSLSLASLTPIDQRHDSTIALPDTSSRYRVISRQNLDAAEVAVRDGASFKGPLKVTNPDEFWGTSRVLILLKL